MQTFFCILRILPSAIVQTKMYRWFYISIKYTIETTVTIDRDVGPEGAFIALAFHSPSRIKKKVHLRPIYIISVYLNNTLPLTTQPIHYPIILVSTQEKKTYINIKVAEIHKTSHSISRSHLHVHAGNSSKPFCMHEWNRFLFIGLYLIHWHGLLWIWGWKYKKRLFIKQKDKRKQVITHMKINLYM